MLTNIVTGNLLGISASTKENPLDLLGGENGIQKGHAFTTELSKCQSTAQKSASSKEKAEAASQTSQSGRQESPETGSSQESSTQESRKAAHGSPKKEKKLSDEDKEEPSEATNSNPANHTTSPDSKKETTSATGSQDPSQERKDRAIAASDKSAGKEMQVSQSTGMDEGDLTAENTTASLADDEASRTLLDQIRLGKTPLTTELSDKPLASTDPKDPSMLTQKNTLSSQEDLLAALAKELRAVTENSSQDGSTIGTAETKTSTDLSQYTHLLGSLGRQISKQMSLAGGENSTTGTAVGTLLDRVQSDQFQDLSSALSQDSPQPGAGNGNGAFLLAGLQQLSTAGNANHAILNRIESLPLAMNQNHWESNLADRTALLLNNQLKEATLRLDPPDLGPLEVKVSLKDNQAVVNFTSQHTAVRDALESAIPRLRELLGNQGFQVVQVDVSSQSATTTSNQERQGQSFNAHMGSGDGNASGSGHSEPTVGVQEGAHGTDENSATSRNNGQVDAYA